MAANITSEPREPSTVASQKELKNALYAKCANLPAERVFNQRDLFALGVIPDGDLNQLLACTKQLSKEGLFRLMTKDGTPCWKVVKKQDAARYKNLSSDEALVYSYIESSGREGMWTRNIRGRTNLHQTVLTRCLKTLETKNLVKQVTSAKYPGRKTYMLVGLQPSEDVTGGPFYEDGQLDEEFVRHMSNWTEKYIIGRSWWHPPLKESTRKKERNRLTKEQAEDLRLQDLHTSDEGRDRSRQMLPMPPGYTGFPTVPEITKAINSSGLSGVVMKEVDMRQLLDVLCWDLRIEILPGSNAYRAVRFVSGEFGEGLENGLTEAPCGRCPVADICEEGGPVNARSCEYFQDWLKK